MVSDQFCQTQVHAVMAIFLLVQIIAARGGGGWGGGMSGTLITPDTMYQHSDSLWLVVILPFLIM